MNIKPAITNRRRLGFTLAEVLVAMTFMAVVVPVVLQGLRLASLAGEVSQRKALAMRVAERVLNETIVTGQWNQNGRNGTEQAGATPLRWSVRNESWAALNNPPNINTAGGVNASFVNPNNLHQLSVDVSFPAQGRTFTVHLSTIVDITKQVAVNTPPNQ